MIKLIKERKELLLFLLMFVAFTFLASIRVDNLERHSVNNLGKENIVYNR